MKSAYKWMFAIALSSVLPAMPAGTGASAEQDAWLNQAGRDADQLVAAGDVPAADLPDTDLRHMLVRRLERQIMSAAEISLRDIDRQDRHEKLRLRIREDIDRKDTQPVPIDAGDMLASDADERAEATLRSETAAFERQGANDYWANSDSAGAVSRLRDDLRPVPGTAGGAVSTGSRLSDGTLHDADVVVSDRDARPSPFRPGRTLVQPSPDNTDSAGNIGSDKPNQSTIRVQPDGSDRNVYTAPGDVRAPGRRTR